MKHKSLLLALILALCFLSSKTQFHGLGSFHGVDTVLRAQVIANRVSSVTERVIQNGVPKYNGHYNFDALGRVVESNQAYGLGYDRRKMEYVKTNHIAKTINYESEDTTKIMKWERSTFDENGRRLTMERGDYQDGKEIISKTMDSKKIVDEKGRTSTEIYQYSGNELSSIISWTDSIVGIYTFYISYEYRPGDVDENGRKTRKKMVRRYYTEDRCLYNDALEYQVYGPIERVKKISTSYRQSDDKGRLVETGEMDYEEVYGDFMQEHPEDFNLNFYSPSFVKAVLEGTVQGERMPDIKYTFDEKGVLLEKFSHGIIYKFKYNDKGQMTEAISEYTTLLIWYNEKGLPSKTVSTYMNPNDVISGKKEIQECTYGYTYY